MIGGITGAVTDLVGKAAEVFTMAGQANALLNTGGSVLTQSINGSQPQQQQQQQPPPQQQQQQAAKEEKKEPEKPDVSSSDAAGKRALAMTKYRQDMNKILIKQNEDLARTMAKLSGLTVSDATLDQALETLALTIETLGKIQRIFVNTRKFWTSVKNNCLQIVNQKGIVEELVDIDDEMLVEAITESALLWFVLGKVNYDAKKAIAEVEDGVDKNMKNLPSKSEALKKVKLLAAEMGKKLKDENNAMLALEFDENPK